MPKSNGGLKFSGWVEVFHGGMTPKPLLSYVTNLLVTVLFSVLFFITELQLYEIYTKAIDALAIGEL